MRKVRTSRLPLVPIRRERSSSLISSMSMCAGSTGCWPSMSTFALRSSPCSTAILCERSARFSCTKKHRHTPSQCTNSRGGRASDSFARKRYGGSGMPVWSVHEACEGTDLVVALGVHTPFFQLAELVLVPKLLNRTNKRSVSTLRLCGPRNASRRSPDSRAWPSTFG